MRLEMRPGTRQSYEKRDNAALCSLAPSLVQPPDLEPTIQITHLPPSRPLQSPPRLHPSCHPLQARCRRRPRRPQPPPEPRQLDDLLHLPGAFSDRRPPSGASRLETTHTTPSPSVTTRRRRDWAVNEQIRNSNFKRDKRAEPSCLFCITSPLPSNPDGTNVRCVQVPRRSIVAASEREFLATLLHALRFSGKSAWPPHRARVR